MNEEAARVLAGEFLTWSEARGDVYRAYSANRPPEGNTVFRFIRESRSDETLDEADLQRLVLGWLESTNRHDEQVFLTLITNKVSELLANPKLA